MAFSKAKEASRLGHLTVILTSAERESETTPGTYTLLPGASYEIVLFDEDGLSARPIDGDLIPHLTISEKTTLLGIMNDIRTRAEGVLL